MHNLKANRPGRGMVLTDRDRAIVRDVAEFQILSRTHLQTLGHFQSKTRANAVLLRLVEHQYLNRRYLPAVAGTMRALYVPGLAAEAVVGDSTAGGEVRRRLATLSNLFVAHQLEVTEVRLMFRPPACHVDRWLSERDLRDCQLGIVPDGHVEYSLATGQFGAFLELDRGTETLDRWRRKVAAYTKLADSPRYRQLFNRTYFRVLAIAPSSMRLDHLCRVTAQVTDKVFWFTTLRSLREHGPFGRIWRRPRGADFHALNES